MKLFSQNKFFIYLLAIYLLYSTISSFSIYNIGVYARTIFILFLCVIGFAIRPRIANVKTDTVMFLFGWGLVFMISTIINGCRPGLIVLNAFLFCLFYFCINIQTQRVIFEKYVWLLSFLILISSIEFVLYRFTGKGLVLAYVTREQTQGDQSFTHLIFNVIGTSLVPRFQGLFKEPGNMGTTCAFMLFVTWRIKSMKFPFIVFLVCGILSLSLAYFVFLLVFLITNIKLTKKNLLGFSLVFVLFLFLFKDVFDKRIVDRINSVDSIEELDNRTTDTLNRAFYKSLESGELWFGVGIDNIPESFSYHGGSSGAKKWVYQYGIISFIIIFFVYNMIYYRRSRMRLNKNDWVFLFVYWACFYKSVIFLTPSIIALFLTMPMINKLNPHNNV